MTEQTAVRYDNEDGIVVLTLDDPTASANTMNDLYRESMKAAVDRLYDERDSIRGVVVASAKKTFFAGGNLSDMTKAGPEDAAAIFSSVAGSSTAKVLPLRASTHSPSIRSLCRLARNAAAAEPSDGLRIAIFIKSSRVRTFAGISLYSLGYNVGAKPA